MALCRLLSRVSLATIALAGVTAAQQAPHFPSDDATLERIWRLGMDSSHVQKLSQTLFDSIGPRLTGSPGIKRGERLGHRHVQVVGHRREARAVRHLARLAARRLAHRSRHAARALARGDDARVESRARRARPVTAPVIVLPKFNDSTEFVKWLPKAQGKIVMLSPAWPTCRPSEDWIRWSTPASMARMDTLIARDAARLGGESGQHEALSRHGLLARARHRHARHASREGRRRRHDHVAHEVLRISEPVSRDGQRPWPRIRRTRYAWAGERQRRRRAGSLARGGTGGRLAADAVVAADVAAAPAAAPAVGGRSRSSRRTTRSRRP